MKVEAVYNGQKMNNNARWLSRGLVLKRFVECLNEIKVFMNGKHVSYQELSVDYWATKLMFFADLCERLNDLNVKLHGNDKTLDVTLVI